jgi:hypothetical protein
MAGSSKNALDKYMLTRNSQGWIVSMISEKYFIEASLTADAN